MSSDERTEQPTYRKLKKARAEGKLLRSQEVYLAMQFGFVLMALAWFGRWYVEALGKNVASGLVEVGAGAHRVITESEFTMIAMKAGIAMAILVGPIALAAVIGGFLATTLQGGWNISWVPLHISFGKLNPAAGLSRLKPSRAGVDLVRTSLALTALAWIAFRAVDAMVRDSMTLGRIPTSQAAVLAWHVAEGFLRRAWVVFALLAGADYGLQWYRYMAGMRMTKQEVKEEMRMMEGSPQVKARIRKAQRAMARKRMLAAVKQATVVVTNPTHFAVALEYKRDRMFAPRVVAKGADHMAAKIKAVAREHNVPIVENVALARALHANAEVGDTIPGDLFEAVAEVLAYLIKLKQLVF